MGIGDVAAELEICHAKRFARAARRPPARCDQESDAIARVAAAGAASARSHRRETVPARGVRSRTAPRCARGSPHRRPASARRCRRISVWCAPSSAPASIPVQPARGPRTPRSHRRPRSHDSRRGPGALRRPIPRQDAIARDEPQYEFTGCAKSGRLLHGIVCLGKDGVPNASQLEPDCRMAAALAGGTALRHLRCLVQLSRAAAFGVFGYQSSHQLIVTPRLAAPLAFK